jgi:hypothetical protein
MCIYGSWISYIHTSVNAHIRKSPYINLDLWKLVVVNVHLHMLAYVYMFFRICTILELVSFHKCTFMEVGFCTTTSVYAHLRKLTTSKIAHIRKCTYMEANFCKCTFTKANIHKCAFTEGGFCICTFMEVRIYKI